MWQFSDDDKFPEKKDENDEKETQIPQRAQLHTICPINFFLRFLYLLLPWRQKGFII